MKFFIDLGAHNGNTLLKALDKYPDFDEYSGYEPIHKLYKESLKRLNGAKKVKIYNLAVGTKTAPITIYEDMTTHKLGSSVYSDKTQKKARKVECTMVSIDVVMEKIQLSDYVVLKIDIEGAEYELLEYMIETKLIDLVDEIYCEWHQHKIPSIPISRHNTLVSNLQKIGFNLTGLSSKDEFYRGI